MPKFRTNKAADSDHVLVYSTNPQPLKKCSECSKELSACRCQIEKEIAEWLPAKSLIRIEKKGRGGKTVSLVARLPADQIFLKDLCKFLKNSLGTGGTFYVVEGQGSVEIQGDYIKQLADLLEKFKLNNS